MKGLDEVRPSAIDGDEVDALAGVLLTTLAQDTQGALSIRLALSVLARVSGVLIAGSPSIKVRDATLARYVALVGDYAHQPQPPSLGGVALTTGRVQ